MIKATVLLWVLTTSVHELPVNAACVECAVERAAVATAQGNYDAALQAWQIAYNNWVNNPNPQTAAVLATAQGNLDAAYQVLLQRQQALTECLGEEEGPGGSLHAKSRGLVSVLE